MVALVAFGVMLFVAKAYATDAALVEHAGPLPQSQIPKYIIAAVNSPNRPAADKAEDSWRRPEQIMAFFGIRPGMKVADISAFGGYTTELLARIVGPEGKVYSQNGPLPPKFKKALDEWKARLKEPGLSNVEEVTESFDSPNLIPVKPNTLDAVLLIMNYHDLVGAGVNMAKMNATIFKALKPGGVYGVIDNSAQPNAGATEVKTLHRIAESYEIGEIEKAGFKLADSSDVLRNPEDPRTLPPWKMNHREDKFVLKFVKP